MVSKEKPFWGNSRQIQTDSYATGQKIVNAYFENENVVIELTNGSSTWYVEVPLPKSF